MSRLHASSRQLTGGLPPFTLRRHTHVGTPLPRGMQIRDVAPVGDDEGRGGGCAHGGDGGADARANPASRTGDDDRRPIITASAGIYEKYKFPDEPVRSPGGRIIKRHPWKTAWSTGAWRRPPPSAPRGATPASTPADDEPAGATMEDRGGEREPAVASPSPSRSPSPASLVGRLAARRRRRAATPSDSEPVMSFESESNSDRSDVENESDLELANAPGLDFGRSPSDDAAAAPASQSRRKRRRRISRITHVSQPPGALEEQTARETPPGDGDVNETKEDDAEEDANNPEEEDDAAAAAAEASQLSVEPLPPPRMATADEADEADETDDEPVPDSDEDPPRDDDDDPLSPERARSSQGLGTAASPVDLTQTADEDVVLGTPVDDDADADDRWACAACTFLNRPDLDACEICERSRPARATPPANRSRQRSIDGKEPFNGPSRVNTSRVEPKEGRRTDKSRRRRLVESDDDGDGGAEAGAEAGARRGAQPTTAERGPRGDPSPRARNATDGGGAVGGKRARGGRQITPGGSGSAGRAARRGALPLVESGGGGRGASRREEPRGKEEEDGGGGEIVISDSENVSEESEDVSEEEDEVETDSDPDADDPYARGLPTPGTAPRRKPKPKSPKRPRYNDVGERVDSGDDSDDESDFEGYDDDMFERAMGGGGARGGGGGGGSSSGGKGRWFTKNGRRVYKVGGREFTGGAAMAKYRRDGGSTGATGGTRRRKTTRKKKGTARRKTTRKKTTRKAKARV